MKRSKAISRATQRLDIPTLPYYFNARLMARVRERAREQRRTDIITSIAASVVVIMMVAYGAATMMKVELPRVELPKIDWAVMFDDMMMVRMRLWGMITLTVVAMFVADMYIRQYFRLRKMRKNEKGGQ